MTKQYDLIVFDWNGTLSVGLELNAEEAVPLREGVPELLAELDRQQYLLALASNMSTRQLLLETELHGIQHYFSEIYGADKGFGKPHPFMLQQILQQTGIEADRALMVGDTQLDVQFAHHAGLQCVVLSDSLAGESEDYLAVTQIRQLSELLLFLAPQATL